MLFADATGDRFAWTTLFVVGSLLALGNVWFTAARSTIPLKLDATIAEREVRLEKHPGHDDVCLWQFDDGRQLQVDQAVYQAVEKGQRVNKQAGQRHLRHGGHETPLDWSADFRGMRLAMPIALALLVGLAWGGRTLSAAGHHPASAG